MRYWRNTCSLLEKWLMHPNWGSDCAAMRCVARLSVRGGTAERRMSDNMGRRLTAAARSSYLVRVKLSWLKRSCAKGINSARCSDVALKKSTLPRGTMSTVDARTIAALAARHSRWQGLSAATLD